MRSVLTKAVHWSPALDMNDQARVPTFILGKAWEGSIEFSLTPVDPEVLPLETVSELHPQHIHLGRAKWPGSCPYILDIHKV